MIVKGKRSGWRTIEVGSQFGKVVKGVQGFVTVTEIVGVTFNPNSLYDMVSYVGEWKEGRP